MRAIFLPHFRVFVLLVSCFIFNAVQAYDDMHEKVLFGGKTVAHYLGTLESYEWDLKQIVLDNADLAEGVRERLLDSRKKMYSAFQRATSSFEDYSHVSVDVEETKKIVTALERQKNQLRIVQDSGYWNSEGRFHLRTVNTDLKREEKRLKEGEERLDELEFDISSYWRLIRQEREGFYSYVKKYKLGKVPADLGKDLD